MSFTVTATGSPGAHADCYLLVKVLTGATEAGGQVASVHNANATAPNTSITPNGTNSLIVWGATADAAATFTLESNNALYGTTIADGDGWAGGFASYTGTVTAATPVTVGVATTTSSDDSTICAYEVKASGGSTPAVDASSPAQVTASTTCTTAAFTPPTGSVMVALFLVSSTGATNATASISDTSGLGLTWTARGVLSGAQDQCAFIFTTTVPAGGAAVTSAPRPVLPPQMFPPLSKRFGPLPPFQSLPTSPTPSTSVSANVAGVAAPVTVQGGVGTFEGDAAVTGVAAPVTVQGGTGTPAGAGGVTGVAAPVTVQGGTGTLSGSAAVTGVAAPVTVQGGVGTPAGAGTVTGVAAVVTVQGGVGTPFGGSSGAANVTGVAAAVAVQGGVGTPSGAAAVAGVAAAVTVQGGVGTLSAGVAVTGVAAHATVQGGTGTVAGAAGVIGIAAHTTVQGGTGTFSAAAAVTGTGAAVQIQGGAGVAAGGGAVFPGTVTVTDRQLDTVLVGDRYAQTCTLTDAATATVTVADRLAQTVTIADQATGTVTIGDQLP